MRPLVCDSITASDISHHTDRTVRLFDHIAKVNADPKLHSAIIQKPGRMGLEFLLNSQCSTRGPGRAERLETTELPFRTVQKRV